MVVTEILNLIVLNVLFQINQAKKDNYEKSEIKLKKSLKHVYD